MVYSVITKLLNKSRDVNLLNTFLCRFIRKFWSSSLPHNSAYRWTNKSQILTANNICTLLHCTKQQTEEQKY